MNQTTIRQATLDDLPEILRQRQAMFIDMLGPEVPLGPMLKAMEAYLREAIPQEKFRAWFAVNPGGKIIGGCAVAISTSPPHPWDPQTRRAYILNLYVDPNERRKGLARLLMQTVVDWCKAEGFGTASLHASHHGRALYESIGFVQTNEMRITLKKQ